MRRTRRAVRRMGFDLVRVPRGSAGTPPLPVDFDEDTAATVHAVRPYTLTSPERIAALCAAVRYVEAANVPGAFVECGVWRGGSVLTMIRTLLTLGMRDRDIWMYDTFTHMPRGHDVDMDIYGNRANDYHDRLDAGEQVDPAYEYLPFDGVRELLLATGYPEERLHFITGLVEQTIPLHVPDKIALLRLDTDYYESTKHEMTHLYPRITPNGVLIVDDYGHWAGCKEAIDEFLADEPAPLLLNRVDYSGRIAVVTDPRRRS